jgi:hypothetical protein
VVEQLTPELVLVDPDLAARARAELADPPDCLAPRPRPEPVIAASTAVDVAPPSPPRPERIVASTTVDVAPPRPRPIALPVRPLADPPLARRDVELEPPLVLPGRVAPRRRRLRIGTLVGSGTWAVVALFVLSPFLAFLPASSSQLPTLVAPVSDAATPDPSEAPDPARSAPATPSPGKVKTTAKPAPATPSPEVKTTAKPEPNPGGKSAPRAQSTPRPTTPARSPEPKRTPVTLEWPASRDAVVYNVIFVGPGGERVDVWTDATHLTLDDVAFENAERRDYTWFAYPGFREGKTVRYGDLAAHGEVRVARAAIPKTQPPPGGQTR